MKHKKYSINCGGFSCLSFVLFFFLLWMIFSSVPTPWGKVSIDIFPPKLDIQK